jgi:hypothetical protein
LERAIGKNPVWARGEGVYAAESFILHVTPKSVKNEAPYVSFLFISLALVWHIFCHVILGAIFKQKAVTQSRGSKAYLVSIQKLDIFYKVKEDEDFNRRNTYGILRIEI